MPHGKTHCAADEVNERGNRLTCHRGLVDNSYDAAIAISFGCIFPSFDNTSFFCFDLLLSALAQQYSERLILVA